MKVYGDGAGAARAPGRRGISKISIQTGTSHGGVPLPDGIDRPGEHRLRRARDAAPRIARETVRHGRRGPARRLDACRPSCSTASRKLGACEIHLADRVPEHDLRPPGLPADLKRDDLRAAAHRRRRRAQERATPTSSSSTRRARRRSDVQARAVVRCPPTVRAGDRTRRSSRSSASCIDQARRGRYPQGGRAARAVRSRFRSRRSDPPWPAARGHEDVSGLSD